MRLSDRAGHPQVAVALQEGAGKVRFPLVREGVEALVLNTSGGLAGGDRFALCAEAQNHALTVSTLACERVYRSEGPPARVRQRLVVGAGAALHHLPQPTIVFDGARLERSTAISVEGSGALTACEGLVLGRAAMGEDVRRLVLADRVDVRIDGRLAFVDALRLDSAALTRLSGPAGLGAARGIGLLLHRSEDLPAALVRLRDALDAVQAGGSVRAGASCVGGLVVARLLAPTHTTLQDALGRAVTALTGRPVPRAWQL